MKNINMKRLILEDASLEPTNTNDFPIKKLVGTDKSEIEIGMSDNLIVYRRKGADGKFSGEWFRLTDVGKEIEMKKKHYDINRGESWQDALKRKRTEKNSGTNQKCVALKTPPAGLTLNITNPGDKNYIYGKVGEEWFAQNIKNKKIFNLTKCNYTTSIAKLEKLKPGGTNASVEQLQSQSKEIQKSAGLPETGSFDIQALERLIKLLSDEEQPKVQSVQDLIPNAKIQTPNAEEQLKQIASQQTIRK
jgi:hypothetical protein